MKGVGDAVSGPLLTKKKKKNGRDTKTEKVLQFIKNNIICIVKV